MIEFEKSNPLRLDAVSLRNRVSFTFKQALLTLRYYPEMWYVSTATTTTATNGSVCRQEYAESFEEKQCMDEAVQVYEQAIEALPSCELMYFLYADFNERRRDFKVLLRPPTDADGDDDGGAQESRRIYDALVATNTSSLAIIELLRFSRRCEVAQRHRHRHP